MAEKMTDELIKEIAYKTDKFIADMLNELLTDENGIHPLEVSAVVFSRLMVLARQLNLEDDFKRLSIVALNIQEPKPIVQ